MCEEERITLDTDVLPRLRRLEERMSEQEQQEATHEHGLTEGLPEMFPALPDDPLVVDPGLARATPCIRVELGEGRSPLIYSRGVIGPLGEEEQALYCLEGYVDHTPAPEHLARLRKLPDAAHACKVETAEVTDHAEHVDAYLSCLERELSTPVMP